MGARFESIADKKLRNELLTKQLVSQRLRLKIYNPFSRSSRTAAFTEYCTRMAGARTTHPPMSVIVATPLAAGVNSTTTPQITASIENANRMYPKLLARFAQFEISARLTRIGSLLGSWGSVREFITL
jgi:hypothetical protein